ncbi:MAG TPA: xylulokinase [Alphaproteobacteria bacterium]|nr:xylulokinase [Alphaproteobacteria bacterium]
MYLGIDLGTSAVKALLVDDHGVIVDSRNAPLSVSRPQAGWSEQDPESWWKATCDAVQALGAACPAPMAAVRCVGLSGQMHGLTGLDAAGDVIRPAILWNDTRSAEQAARMDADMPAFRSIGGNAVMPGFTAPKAVWMRESEPERFDAIDTILLPKDYLRFRMSGDRLSEMSDSAGTLWLDVARRDWSDELLGLCGLSRDQMPGLVEGSAPAGQLRADVAKDWGIEGQPVIAGGGGDNAAAAVGLGAVTTGDAFCSLGTSGVVFTVTDSFAPAAASGAHAFCHAIPDSWHQMGVILAASDCVAWLCEITGADVGTLMAELDGGDDFACDLMFHPYLSGERTPHNDADARGGFFGLARHHGRAEMTRAVLQGVSFAIADATDVLRKAGGAPEMMLATGGGAKNELWLSYIAAMTGVPIVLPEDGDFGAALGAARLAMMADGIAVEDVCHKPKTQAVITPDTAMADALTPTYHRWRDIYHQLQQGVMT